MARGRHCAPRRFRPAVKGLAMVLLAVVSAVGGLAAVAPASMLPGGHEVRSCLVTGGGTLRVFTHDCGTLPVRGRIRLLAGARYQVEMWGPLAVGFAREA